jgi:hypothetical protein
MATESALASAVRVSSSQPTTKLRARRLQHGRETLSALPEIVRPTTVAERWASYVLGACRSDRDPRTIGIWARQVAVSYTTLCESCRLIEVQPRQARDFARVLRLVVMPSFDSRHLATFLDISDRRTLNSILRKAGFKHSTKFSQHVSVTSFLDHQQFIPSENAGLRKLRDIFGST